MERGKWTLAPEARASHESTDAAMHRACPRPRSKATILNRRGRGQRACFYTIGSDVRRRSRVLVMAAHEPRRARVVESAREDFTRSRPRRDTAAGAAAHGRAAAHPPARNLQACPDHSSNGATWAYRLMTLSRSLERFAWLGSSSPALLDHVRPLPFCCKLFPADASRSPFASALDALAVKRSPAPASFRHADCKPKGPERSTPWKLRTAGDEHGAKVDLGLSTCALIVHRLGY